MNKLVTVSLLLLVASAINGCKKGPADTPPPPPTDATETVAQKPEATQAQPEKSEVTAVAEKASEKTAAIPLKLPKPMFVGTPENLSGVERLEKPLGKPRAAFFAPEGTENIALNKPVTGSEEDPITGTLEMIVDGNKEASDGSMIELGPFEQWAQIELEEEHSIYAIVLWHFHKTPRVYFDVVVQVSDDPDFATEVTTVFNNDIDNSLGMGAGSDMHYVETAEGKLVDAKGVKGRYVRLYSQGNNQNDYSHYVEVEVYGK